MFQNPVYFFLALQFSTFATLSTANAQLDQQTVRFVEDVLFNTEFELNPRRFCKLWKQAPTLSTFGPDDHHPKVINNVVKQLNECLPENLAIEVLSPNDRNATLKVYFVPLSSFPEIAAENNFEVVENNWGFFATNWNYKYEIENAVVLIATDKLSGTRLNHFVLEEITQSLGFPGDSKRFEKSIFFENAALRKFGRATNLSRLDQKLVRFHYRYNQAGDTPIEVGIKMAKKW